MRVVPLALAGLLVAAVGVPTAAAIDPLVYRECLAQCRQFKDRGCCHETCSYTACIADKTKTNMGHGTKRDGMRVDQTDPGAWSAAMAACYPWISILKECSAGSVTPPAPAASPKPGALAAPVTGTIRPRSGATAGAGRVVLRRVGPPQPTKTDTTWVTVSSGTIVNKGHGYEGRYTWDEPPAEILESGHTIQMKAVAECSNGQRLYTGLAIAGDLDLVGPASPEPKGRVEFPANCESTPGNAVRNEGGGAVKIAPRKGYAAGTRVRLAIGVFWGAEVVYMYEAVGSTQ